MKKISVALLFLFMMMLFPQWTQAAEKSQFIIINKSINKLAFYEDGKLVKIFPVATGKTNSLTPEGIFPIVNKIKNRPYYKENIPGGSPENPLGDRWLGLDARGTYGTTYAIHGNNNASSIGKYVSAGCVRMHNDDVHWLFDRVKMYTKVIIVSSSKTFDEIAIEKGFSVAPPIKVVVDGKELKVNVPPFMENNRVLVPMRAIFTELGANVIWDAKTKTITAKKGKTEIKLKINSKQATINGKQVTLDVAPTIQRNTTFVPTRFVSEALGVEVKWDQKKRTVTLNLPKPPKQTSIDIKVNEHLFTGNGYLEEGTAMMPVSSVFTKIGAGMNYDAATSTATITYKGKVLMLQAGSNTVILDGTSSVLPREVTLKEGRLYAPAKAIVQLLSGSITYDQPSNTLIITLN